MSDRGRRNTAAAEALLAGLRDGGLAHVALSPGSRSTPLALAAATLPGLSLSIHLDERSAAFCALGFARASGRPAAMVCTSGTAGANAYGAVIEAWHSRIPLLVLTADRPPELRAAGAWQTIDQHRLFGSFLRLFLEAAPPGEALELPAERYFADIGRRAARAALGWPPGPVQLNLPFREPLAPEAPWPGGEPAVAAPPAPAGPSAAAPSAEAAVPADPAPAPALGATPWPRPRPAPRDAAGVAGLARACHAAPRGLIVAGLVDPAVQGLDPAAWAGALGRLSAATGFPLLAEVASGLRFGAQDASQVIDGYDAFLRPGPWSASQAPDLVLRFGASLTWRPVNQYLAAHPGARHLVFDALDQGDDPARLAADRSGAGSPPEVDALARAIADLGPRAPGAAAAQASWLASWLRARDLAEVARRQAVERAPEGSTLWLHAQLPGLLAEDSLVVLANSMAVRDLDSFGGRGAKGLRFLCNRGAAGIDGTVSTAVGAALHRAAAGLGPTVLVTGDLAFLHDVNGLGIMGLDRRQAPDLTVIVLDDGGGAIFGYLPVAGLDAALFDRCFRTDPGADLAAGCALYGIPHRLAAGRAAFREAWAWAEGQRGIRVIVLAVDMAANQAAHQAYWAAVLAGLAGDLAEASGSER